MPTVGEKIKFKSGTYSEYATAKLADEIDSNAIYFCTDTNQIFVGSSEYTRPVQSGQGAPTSQSASTNPIGTLYYDSTNNILYSNLSNSWVAISDKNTPIDITGQTIDLNDLLLDDLDVGIRYYVCTDQRQANNISNLPSDGVYWSFTLLVQKTKGYIPYDSSLYEIDINQTLITPSGQIYKRLIYKLSNSSSSYIYNDWKKVFPIQKNHVYYGTCASSEASKEKKIITFGYDQNFEYSQGAVIGVLFEATNTYSGDIKLNVDGDYFACPVKYNGSTSSIPSFTKGIAGHINYYMLVYGNAVWIGTDYEIDTTYSPATQSTDGLMSSTDKVKLDNMGGIFLGTCASIEANKQVKNIIVSDQNFALKAGTIVAIKFAATNTYSSTAAAPIKFTFNSGVDEYLIYYKNAFSPTGITTQAYGAENYIIYYMFDGTNLTWVSNGFTNNYDTKVTQSAAPQSGIYDLLMAKTAGSHTTETDTSYKSGTDLNFDVANKKLKIGGNNALTTEDIVVCTQAEYDAMQTRTALLYVIKEEST